MSNREKRPGEKILEALREIKHPNNFQIELMDALKQQIDNQRRTA